MKVVNQKVDTRTIASETHSKSETFLSWYRDRVFCHDKLWFVCSSFYTWHFFNRTKGDNCSIKKLSNVFVSTYYLHKKIVEEIQTFFQNDYKTHL
jgi:hypothetical protein